MADNVGSKISYFLAGLGIGALVGVLFAPKSGEERGSFFVGQGRRRADFAQKKARGTGANGQTIGGARQRCRVTS